MKRIKNINIRINNKYTDIYIIIIYIITIYLITIINYNYNNCKKYN